MLVRLLLVVLFFKLVVIVEAVVVVVTHLRGVHLEQEDDEKRRRVGEFARGLHDKWGVGSKKCSNGVLIAIDYGDRAFYLSTGEGVRGAAVRSGVSCRAVCGVLSEPAP